MSRWKAVTTLARQRHLYATSLKNASFVRHRSVLASQESDVRILEVGPRDGLQNIKTKVDTSVKIELIRRLAASGLRAIEATSFVAPKWIPQLADSQEVMTAIHSSGLTQSVNFPVLVPNMKGFEQAAQNRAQEAVVFASASEGFSWKNTNCSVEEGLKRAEEVVNAARGVGMRARGYDARSRHFNRQRSNLLL